MVKVLQFYANSSIYRVGDSVSNIYKLISGKVKIVLDGVEKIIEAGEYFGESALFEKASESAVAITDIEVQQYSVDEISASVEGLSDEIKAVFRFLYEKSQEKSQEKTVVATAPKQLDKNAGDQPVVNIAQSYTELDLGPLRVLLEDDDVSDVLVNGASNVFIEKAGLLNKTEIRFKSEEELLQIAENIVKEVGRKLDKRRPIVDARLQDGSRVNVIAPPLAVDGTALSIRKFSKKAYTLDSMAEGKAMSQQMADFLKIAAECKLNMIISGGTGAGKTTMLNAISSYIGSEERIVTIEDAAELKLQQPHVVRLETKPLEIGGNKEEEVAIRDLVKNSLRMRPDRIVVGEVRGAEAFDMLQAMNTGHEGSMTTIHANHPRDVVSRLESMISTASLGIPEKTIRHIISSAINLIIQVSRGRDGRRRIAFISEVTGMEGDVVVSQDLFVFKPMSEDEKGFITGKYEWTGIMPRFMKRIAYYGHTDSLEKIFGFKFKV